MRMSKEEWVKTNGGDPFDGWKGKVIRLHPAQFPLEVITRRLRDEFEFELTGDYVFVKPDFGQDSKGDSGQWFLVDTDAAVPCVLAWGTYETKDWN